MQTEINIFSNSSLSNTTDRIFYNFFLKKHIETHIQSKQLNMNENSIEKKAIFDMKYNQYYRRYEEFINNRNPTEIDLPALYNIAPGASDILKTDITSIFENIENNISKYSSEVVTIFESNNILKKANSYKLHLPMYTSIIFENIIFQKKGFVSLFQKYNILTNILDLFLQKNISPNTDVFINLADIVSIPEISGNSVFLANLIGLLNEKTSNLSTTSLSQINENVKTNPENITNFEIVAYKISKFYGTRFSDPVQEWIIPNSDDSLFEFVDSQVKYGTNYLYKLSFIVAYVATKYSDQLKTPVLVMREVESTRYENSLFDSPPISPNFSFIPSLGVDNKIKIYLENPSGEYKIKPIKIIQSDDIQYRLLSRAQNINSGDNLYFKGDGSVSSYQIFRLSTKPTMYDDFSNGDIISLEEGLSTYEDNIRPNVTYYYTFRSVDVHGLISNPTKIYSLTMVNDNGTIYPISGIYELPIEILDNKESNMKFKRFLGIAPRGEHLIFDEEAIGSQETELTGQEVLRQVNIGTLSPSIWDKKFKIRLTSISSGKKFDVNINYRKLIKKT